MTPVLMNDQLHNGESSVPVRDDRKGKQTILSQRSWAVVALLAAGWFLHDAVWHIMLVLFGMNAFIGMEFSLPDLGAYHIYPDRVVQIIAFLFATVVAGLLLWLGLGLNTRS